MKSDMPPEVRAVFDRIVELPLWAGVRLDHVNASNSDGDNALHWAARAGDLDAAIVLLAAGIDIDKRGDLGHTPLHEAAGAGHKEMVLLLVERGADLYALTEGDTPFGVARALRQDHICDVLGPRMKADEDPNKWTRLRIEHLKGEIRRLEQDLAK
jgi:ankyrin repeat protein